MIYAVPVVVAIVLWWLTTVAALYRIGLPRSTYRYTLAGASVLALIGLAVVVYSLSETSVMSAYLAFAGALAIWSWHELSYYLGYVSGPSPVTCPEGCSTWERFVFGVKASLYHELAIVLTAVALWALSWQAANTIALSTFCILWVMRWSAKMNIFLGARNVHMEFLPHHLQYLASFMTERRMNLLFPFSVVATLGVLWLIVSSALAPTASSFVLTGNLLLAVLLVLALLEHIALMLKIPDAVLWRLGTASRRAGSL